MIGNDPTGEKDYVDATKYPELEHPQFSELTTKTWEQKINCT